jgi:hypothetical protein
MWVRRSIGGGGRRRRRSGNNGVWYATVIPKATSDRRQCSEQRQPHRKTQEYKTGTFIIATPISSFIARQRGSCPLRPTIDRKGYVVFVISPGKVLLPSRISGIEETFFVLANAPMTARFRTPAMLANKNASV